MRLLGGWARFVWEFVVGDDWRVAAAVVVGLGVTAAIGHTAWFVLPTVVIAILGLSVFAVARARRLVGE